MKQNDKKKCVVIHPQQFQKYFEYTKVVRLLLRTNMYESIVLFINSINVDWVKEIYTDLVHDKKVFIVSIDNNNEFCDLFHPGITKEQADRRCYDHLRLAYEGFDIKGYEEFDMVRSSTDRLKGVHNANYKTGPKDGSNDQHIISRLYSEELMLSNRSFEDIEFVLPRDLNSETLIMNKLKKILQFKFAIISDDKYKSLCHDNEMNCINIKKLFPKSHRMSHWIPLLQKAVFLVVSDDEVAAFVYTLQTESTGSGKPILNSKQKVYFVVPPHKHKTDYPFHNKLSWKFV